MLDILMIHLKENVLLVITTAPHGRMENVKPALKDIILTGT